MRTEVPCDPNSEEFRWEDFATPGKLAASTNIWYISIVSKSIISQNEYHSNCISYIAHFIANH